MLTRLRNSWKRFLHLQSKNLRVFQSIFHFLGMKVVQRGVPKKHSVLQPLLTGVIFIYETCWLLWDDFHVWKLLVWLITAECFLWTHFRMPLYTELRRWILQKKSHRGLVSTFYRAKNNLDWMQNIATHKICARKSILLWKTEGFWALPTKRLEEEQITEHEELWRQRSAH